jgi:hypothetical protein
LPPSQDPLTPNREALGLSLKRHGERLARQALELRQHLAAVCDFRVGRSIEALTASAETLYDVGIDVLCGRARLRPEGEAAAPAPDPTPLITAIEAAAPAPDPTPRISELEADARFADPGKEAPLLDRVLHAEVDAHDAIAAPIETDVEMLLAAESDADAQEDKEAVSSLAGHGLGDETLAKLDKSGFFWIEDLADSVDAGDLADDCPKLSDDEVDAVVKAVRAAGGGSAPEPKTDRSPDRPLTDEDLDKALLRSLHSFQGAAGRWKERKKSGLSDDALKAAIAFEFGSEGGSVGPGEPSIHVKGLTNPRFWASWEINAIGKRKPDLSGKALLERVRKVMGIPTPKAAELLVSKTGGNFPGGPTVEPVTRPEPTKPLVDDWRTVGIEDLELSPEVTGALSRAGLTTAGAVADFIKDRETGGTFGFFGVSLEDYAATKDAIETIRKPFNFCSLHPPAKPKVNKKAYRAAREAALDGPTGAEVVPASALADFPVQPDAGQSAPPEPEAKKPRVNKKEHRAKKARAEAPDSGPWLFAVYPGGSKNPAYAVLAPSRLAAIHYAKVQHERSRVEPDTGQVARLGLVVRATLDKSGGVIADAPAMQGARV